MPMKNPSQLHPRGDVVVKAKTSKKKAPLKDTFDPEAGKASDNPFGEHISASSEPEGDASEVPSEEATSNDTVSEYDDTQTGEET